MQFKIQVKKDQVTPVEGNEELVELTITPECLAAVNGFWWIAEIKFQIEKLFAAVAKGEREPYPPATVDYLKSSDGLAALAQAVPAGIFTEFYINDIDHIIRTQFVQKGETE